MPKRYGQQFAMPTLAVAAAVLFGYAVLLRAGEPSNQQEVSVDDQFPRETLPNCAGGTLSLNKARGQVATVLVCMSFECPISNEYVPTLNRLASAFKNRGVNFVGLNPNAGEMLTKMAEQARGAKLNFPLLQDQGGKISRSLRFQVTPEVCVFDAQGKQVYFGRIDDRYRARAVAAADASSTDLQKALDELEGNKQVTVSRTKAMGCPIQYTAPPAD